MNPIVLAAAPAASDVRPDIRIFESEDAPADVRALAVLRSGVADADLAAPAVVLPDFHLKADKEMPSSIAIATRDTIRTTMTCCSLNCGWHRRPDANRPTLRSPIRRGVRSRLPFLRPSG